MSSGFVINPKTKEFLNSSESIYIWENFPLNILTAYCSSTEFSGGSDKCVRQEHYSYFCWHICNVLNIWIMSSN